MKKPSAVVVLLVIGSVFLPPPTSACPVIPTLWGLVGESELIVLARVESVETAPPTEDSDDSGYLYLRDVAVLRVLETWKGESRIEVRVQFRSGPFAVLREGEVVLAFLESGETRAANARKAWDTDLEDAEWLEEVEDPEELREIQEGAVRRSEEIRAFTEWSAGLWFDLGPLWNDIDRPVESERPGLRELVELAVRLHRADPDGEDTRREWLLAAAERRITRGESLSPLLWMTRRPPPAVDEEAGELEEPPVEALTEGELARLAAAFAREPALDFSDVRMLKLLEGYTDLEVDRAAASVVEAGLVVRPIPAWVPAMVAATLRRYGDSFQDRIGRDDVDPRGRPIYTGEGENTLPTIWEVARRELGIPAVVPAEAPERAGRPRWAATY